ncbi:MAG: tRNA lysidine(34) synthetase TilS [Deltaproteobacteria bacterium]|nr:tRNA lysidine(34) synthetase TilS [Deltaproteobacteria bacterium]
MSRGQASIPQSLRDHLPRNSRLLLAVSGGIDSMVLLHACCSLRRELALHVEVAHINHNLRSCSNEDAAFVEREARSVGLPFHILQAQRAESSENVESWGRRVRYEYFEKLCKDHALQATVTAHQADDVAETLLMRLVSNKEPGELCRFDARRRLVRPLLDVTRAMIENYAREHGVAWREDPTNSDEAFLRNKVRHSLMPLLRQQFDQRMSEVLSLRAQALADDSNALDAWSHAEAERLEGLSPGSRDWLIALRAVLAALETAVQWRVARDVFASAVGFDLGRSRAEDLVDFILGNAEGIELPSGLTLKRKDGGLLISRR